MRYLCLIYHDEKAVAAMSEVEMGAVMEAYGKYSEELEKAGVVGRVGSAEFRAAAVAEARLRRVGARAGSTGDFQRGAAGVAEARVVGVRMLAGGAVHRWLPAEEATAAESKKPDPSADQPDSLL